MLVGEEGAALQDFSDEDESENFPMSRKSFCWKKNLVCNGGVRPEREAAVCKNFGKGQRRHVRSTRGTLAHM